MKKYLQLSGILLLGMVLSVKAQTTYYPYVLGWAAGEQVLHEGNGVADTFKVSFSGGAPFSNKWQTHAEGYKVLLGFKHDILFAENAFGEDLFASKGYYGDYIELKWDLINYASQVTAFKIYRKELGSTDDSIMVANLASTERSWKDEYAESGMMYEYTLYALGVINTKQQKFLNYVSGVGFRVPTGRISGRVTYEGGAAVPNVNIVAETDDNFSGSSVQLNGTDAYLAISPSLNDPLFKLDTAFTFQAWFRAPDAATTKCLFEKQGQYKLTHADGVLTFTAGGTQSLVLNFTEKVDTFFHVTAMRTADSLKLIVFYDEYTSYVGKALLTATTTANNNDITIGKSSTGEFFQGYVDEVRLWHRSFTEKNAILDAGRYIAGTENNLTGYYRLNESVGDNFYDLSRKGFTFNEHHGYKSSTAQWSATVPMARQLSVKGITDNNGNYLISGIPYATDGTVYRFVPVYGIHSFNPTEQLKFIGTGSTVHSGVDFVDVASFAVVGYVFYRNTNFPVEGVNLNIDGQLAIASNGTPIKTDATGKFILDVPIGQHYIELEKYGHGFENAGRFPYDPANPDSLFDFQQPYTFQTTFKDTTLIKVIGKVVGGPVQAAKPKGMGKTINNIGNGKIIFGTQKGYDLTNNAAGISTNNTNESYENNIVVNDGTTVQSIIAGSLQRTEIQPDPTTGEYVAYLLPEKHIVVGITAGTYTYPSSFHTTLDLKNSIPFITEIDSVITGIVITGSGEEVNTYRLDSIRYQKNLDFIYRVTPNIGVINKVDGDSIFWEREVVAKDGTTIALVDAGENRVTDWPIFVQRKGYEIEISVFEQYINADNSNVADNVPVTDGILTIQNDLSSNNTPINYEIGGDGTAVYKFNAGMPNTIGDFTKSMSIVAYTGNGGTIQTAWSGNNNGSFKGYVFGGMPTGSNFVTAGPSKTDMVIRDPYGSSSYAFYEVGNSVSKTSSYDVTNSNAGTETLTAHLGGSIATVNGIGVAVMTEVEIEDDVSIGISHEEIWLDNNTTTSTTTNTKTWQTSSDAEYVGAPGDLFIGHSVNIVYGVSNMLDFIPNTECAGACVDPVGSYGIGLHKTIRVNPEFGTGFQFTQNHIENYLIPNLEMLRDLYLLNSIWHTSPVLNYGDDGYAALNTTVTESKITTATDTIITRTGDSYNVQLIIFGAGKNWTSTVDHFIDSVQMYNTQIENWKKILYDNEKEKKEATLIENLSFDAGVVYSSSTTYDDTEAKSSSFEFSVAPTVSGTVGGAFNGFGLSFSFEETYSHTETKSDGTEVTNSVTFGYELSDPDEGDYFSIDVKKPKSHTGPVFATRGGQSQCPFEDAEVTEYFQPGTILSEATMQREVPSISCIQPIQINVPEDEPAIFNIKLGNASQTDDEAWLMVVIDEQSNQNGAVIKMDGTAINNGRVIFIPASTVINKVFTIEKTDPAVNDYNNIGIILRSVCQFDPGNNWPDIADTVLLTANFQPVCANVDITTPADLWVVNTNTGTDLVVNIGNYNLSHTGFTKVSFQYKPISSSQWITDMDFYVNQVDYIAATNGGQTVQWINSDPSISYTWDMMNVQDRNYDIRAISTCADGTTNSSPILTGIKDIKRPKVFGTPQPGDGILEPGDDVMITFDEEIEDGLLLSTNFSVRGVLNGATLTHNSALLFDGIDDYASALAGVNLGDKSFSVEFWTKRADLTQGAVFQQAGIEIGFNASNQLYVKLGSTSANTSNSYAFTDKWIHCTVSFDEATRNVNIHVLYDGYNSTDLTDQNYPDPFQGNGKMYVGNNQDGSSAYNGYMHDLRVWEKVVGYGESNANKDISMTGNEVSLSGFWPMNDLSGNQATDLSRSHHAVLYGPTWQVFPPSYCRVFDGASRLDLNTASTVVINNYMDFTLEFWFKGDVQANTVLFSNGKADGTEAAGAMENIWIVGFNADGNLYAKNNGTSITNTTIDLLDNEWHHFALVLKRKGNTNMYVDGNLTNYAASTAFGGLYGNGMTIGASRHYSNGIPYSNNFTGSIDEFRIWKLARTSKLLAMDKNSKLKGDEIGLVAYYPFDAYDINLILQPTFEDQDRNDATGILTGLSVTPTGGSYSNTNVPSIKDARPVQNLAFSWVVNTDKIIINIDEPEELVEKCVLEFTTERIQDLNENRMGSPETWTAYVNRNTIVWGETDLSFSKLLYDGLSFNVDVFNTGGIEQNYSITNLPSWLSASSASGTLTPVSSKTITFTVDPSTNIGNYDITLYLTSDFGYNEKLNISLKVFQTPPNWVVDETSFQYSMGILAQVKIDGIFSTNIDDMVGAFVNGECRGVASLEYVEQYDIFEVFLNVYSNIQSGDSIEFKIWDAAQGVIHINATPKLIFEYNTFVGTPAVPITIESNNSISKELILPKGWKWVSFNLNDPNLSDLDALFVDISNETGDQVKGQSVYDNYVNAYGWAGSLSGAGGLQTDQTYMVKTAKTDTLLLAGPRINPLTTTITLNTGWNWIGYSPQSNINIQDALGGFNPTSGDIIKSQYEFSMYDPSMGWIGSLDYLIPGEGYMYKNVSASGTSFTFPEVSGKRSGGQNKDVEVNGWGLVKEQFQYNMSIIGELLLDGFTVTENHIIGAFVGDECRGIVQPTVEGSKTLYYFTIYGNAGDIVTYKLIDNSDGSTGNIDQTTEFISNQVLGNHPNPYPFTAKMDATGIHENNLSSNGTGKVTIYPNPTSGKVYVELTDNDHGGVIEVTDITGKRLQLVRMSLTIQELDLSKYDQGTYFISVYTPEKNYVHKINVVK